MPHPTLKKGSPVSRRQHCEIDSPVGPLTLVATDGALSGLFMIDQRHRPAREVFGTRDPSPFPVVIDQLGEYFAGERRDFDLPLAAVGTPFQQRVWAALRQVTYGQTVSYGRIAERIDRPGASRAVGLANGANPIGIIVPCHRVVGADGSLTGYGGGLERKQFLLDLERRSDTPDLHQRSPPTPLPRVPSLATRSVGDNFA
ncbi:MAG: methylated-DNA--[protein]-cysteine S-methyltransferase [Actinomycetota bacterium]|nr:methylated-DNA--[protein]-cysteine S-methyltransferase [Actinomycetota bacterium]